MDALHKELLDACLKARAYLVDRGIRYRGTEGRTKVLPLLDSAISNA